MGEQNRVLLAVKNTVLVTLVPVSWIVMIGFFFSDLNLRITRSVGPFCSMKDIPSNLYLAFKRRWREFYQPTRKDATNLIFNRIKDSYLF